ncbi:MAG TPA: cytochrome c [Opitutaceae bacterium]|jgi:mono/diheme cytochrome c family protein
MRKLYLSTFLTAILLVSLLGFRGTKFTRPPADVFPEWLFPGMKRQPKYKPMAASTFFADGRADRMPVPDTVPASYGPAGQAFRGDDHLYLGKNPDGSFARGFPASITVGLKLLERGRDRFDIYCAPCHGRVGDGNGVTKRYGMGATPSYHDDRLRSVPDGYIFDIITNGKQPANNMPPYADKLTPEDRWAVVAYVRALQRAAHATVDDVPADHRADLGLK